MHGTNFTSLFKKNSIYLRFNGGCNDETVYVTCSEGENITMKMTQLVSNTPALAITKETEVIEIRIQYLPKYALNGLWTWSARLGQLLLRHGQLREIYLWISSLGAAHSALATSISRSSDPESREAQSLAREHAENAEKKATSQACIAYQLGDEGLVGRCLVYVAIARALKGKKCVCMCVLCVCVCVCVFVPLAHKQVNMRRLQPLSSASSLLQHVAMTMWYSRHS
jgi:hypothetical protein